MSVIKDLYHTHFVEKQDERLDLFVKLAARFPIRSALYPGSFVHITPAFIFPELVFVDQDARAKRYFESGAALARIRQEKKDAQAALIRFHAQDFSQSMPEREHSFDLLISQYAGIISQDCKRYLKPGGWLLANNSHADAGVAALDPDYDLVAAVSRRGSSFSLLESNLDAYFKPKKAVELTIAGLRELGRGVAYQKSAFAYIFQLKG